MNNVKEEIFQFGEALGLSVAAIILLEQNQEPAAVSIMKKYPPDFYNILSEDFLAILEKNTSISKWLSSTNDKLPDR